MNVSRVQWLTKTTFTHALAQSIFDTDVTCSHTPHAHSADIPARHCHQIPDPKGYECIDTRPKGIRMHRYPTQRDTNASIPDPKGYECIDTHFAFTRGGRGGDNNSDLHAVDSGAVSPTVFTFSTLHWSHFSSRISTIRLSSLYLSNVSPKHCTHERCLSVFKARARGCDGYY